MLLDIRKISTEIFRIIYQFLYQLAFSRLKFVAKFFFFGLGSGLGSGFLFGAKSRLKFSASSNISIIFVTLDTSQLVSGWLFYHSYVLIYSFINSAVAVAVDKIPSRIRFTHARTSKHTTHIRHLGHIPIIERLVEICRISKHLTHIRDTSQSLICHFFRRNQRNFTISTLIHFTKSNRKNYASSFSAWGRAWGRGFCSGQNLG